MSLISEQVKRLRELALKNSGNPNAMFLKHCADTIEELSAKLAAQNMERSTAYYNSGWIPCREQTPEEHGRYLVSYGKDTRVFIEEWDGHWFSERHYFEQPKAWMPLPEPWKGE